MLVIWHMQYHAVSLIHSRKDLLYFPRHSFPMLITLIGTGQTIQEEFRRICFIPSSRGYRLFQRNVHYKNAMGRSRETMNERSSMQWSGWFSNASRLLLSLMIVFLPYVLL